MIYELEKTAYEKACPLFQGMGYSQLFAEAIFEGNHAGRVFVDDPERPTAALLAPLCEFFFIVGQTENIAFNQAMRVLILSELVSSEGDMLLFPASEAWQSTLDKLFADYARLHVARKAFTFDPEVFVARHAGWRERIPSGYSIRQYDRALAEGTELADFWGGLDNFLARGVGFAVMKGDEIVSRCHSVMVGGGEAEINIETADPYRRQGFARLAACAFIEQCLEQGLRPAWSCWDNNIPSQILAQQLGFNHPVDVPAIYTKVK
ncbi:MAG TPA: GNAT family N-acetyltransferase [Anaerolineae bacterium]|nr:GNAT family N-acetyltransferase [Anaerolineae bacterium]HQK13600.1 GNAT family N-acetyltransferase [Anaerolineae bacterium]